MCIETKYIYLKSHPLFNELDEVKLAEISTVVKVHTAYRAETVDYGEGEYSKIYFVVKGKIKIAESNEMGEELIKDILTEGDFFGNLSLYGNASPDEYAEALTANTILCSFKVSDFRKILQHNPMMALNYVNKVSVFEIFCFFLQVTNKEVTDNRFFHLGNQIVCGQRVVISKFCHGRFSQEMQLHLYSEKLGLNFPN